MRSAALALTLSCSALACSVPVGMYGHEPAALWSAPVTPASQPLAAPQHASLPIVMKRFQNLARVPVGAHFVLDSKAKGGSREAAGEVPADAIAQGYAPSTDLSIALFESAYARLSTAGYPIWKDYWPSEAQVQGPPDTAAFVVLVGSVADLEVDTFAADRLYEAARVVIDLRLLGAQGAELQKWQVSSVARLVRGQGDLLQLMGELVADQIAKRLDGLPSVEPEPNTAQGGHS